LIFPLLSSRRYSLSSSTIRTSKWDHSYIRELLWYTDCTVKIHQKILIIFRFPNFSSTFPYSIHDIWVIRLIEEYYFHHCHRLFAISRALLFHIAFPRYSISRQHNNR
jgi:hypothetical protein